MNENYQRGAVLGTGATACGESPSAGTSAENTCSRDRTKTISTTVEVPAVYGFDADSALELYVCGLDKFQVDAKEGGTSSIEWSMSSNKQVTPELVGALCDLEGGEIVATLTPPASTAGVIDGSVDAFKRDHPEADPNQGDMLDGDHDGDDQGPTDAFLAQHGADSDGEPADDAPPASTKRSRRPAVAH